MRRSLLVSITLACVLLAGLASIGPSVASATPGWATTQLTTVAGLHQSLQVSGGRTVWMGYDGTNWQIFTQKIGVDALPVQLTTDAHDHDSPQVSGDRVVWCGYDGANYQVFTRKIGADASPVQLTSITYSLMPPQPQVSGDRIVWVASDGTNWQTANDQIFTQKIGVDSSPIQLTTDANNHESPQVSGDRVVWQLGSDGISVPNPQIFTQKIGLDSSPIQLTHDGNDMTYFSTQNVSPQVSGDRIVWLHGAGMAPYHSQVYMQKIGVDASPIQLTTDARNHFDPQVSGDRVVWYAANGCSTQKIGVDSSPTQLPGSLPAPPAVSGDRVVWWGYDGASYQVFTQKIGTDASPVQLTTDADSVQLANVEDNIGSVGVSGDQVVLDTSVMNWSVPSSDVAGQIFAVSPLLDTTPPTTTLSALPAANAAGWNDSPVTLTLTATDGPTGSGVAGIHYRLGSGADTTYSGPFTIPTEGTTTIHYWSVDNAGNPEVAHTGYVNIDLTNPTVSNDAPSTWGKVPVTITLTSNDTGGSGLAGTQYRLAGSSTWLDTLGNKFTVSAEGSHSYEYRALDNAGNASSPTSGCTVRIDASAPNTTVSGAPSGWSKTAVTLHFVGSDAFSGWAKTEYQLNGGAWITATSCPIAAQGLTSCAYRSTDVAGNLEATKTVTVSIDGEAPTTTASAASVKHNKTIKLRYKVTDAAPGSSASVTLKIFHGTKLKKTLAAGTCTTSATVIHAYSWKCTLAKGGYTIKVYATDAAGNVQSHVGSAKLTVK